jgi:hypothetical protein
MVFSSPYLVSLAILVASQLASLAQAAEDYTCYRLSYNAVPPTDPGDIYGLPIAVALGSGSESGKLLSRANPAERIKFWGMFQNDRARWTRPAPNRLLFGFTNGFTAVRYDLVGDSDSFSGIATIEYDVIDVNFPRFNVTGQRDDCAELDQ